MDSTWEPRDLRVLTAIVELSEEGARSVHVEGVAYRTGLSEEVVQASFLALAGEEPPYCQFVETQRLGARRINFAHSPTGHARRAVGAWPTPEGLADRIVSALEQAAAEEPDPERKTRLKRAADAIGGVGKGVVTGVLTHVLTQGV